MAERRDILRATPEYAARPVALPSSLSELNGQTRRMWEERFPELQPADDYSRWEGEGGHPPYNERGATLA